MYIHTCVSDTDTHVHTCVSDTDTHVHTCVSDTDTHVHTCVSVSDRPLECYSFFAKLRRFTHNMHVQ